MGSRANATIAYGIDFGMRLDWDVIDEPEPFAAVAYGQSGACSYVLANGTSRSAAASAPTSMAAKASRLERRPRMWRSLGRPSPQGSAHEPRAPPQRRRPGTTLAVARMAPLRRNRDALRPRLALPHTRGTGPCSSLLHHACCGRLSLSTVTGRGAFLHPMASR